MWRSQSLQEHSGAATRQQQHFPETARAGGTHAPTDTVACELAAALTAAEKRQQAPCPSAEPARMNKVGWVEPDSVELRRLLSRTNTETTVLRETGHKRPHTVRLHVPPKRQVRREKVAGATGSGQ